MTMRLATLMLVFTCAGLWAPFAHAQFAVVDVGAIAQLIQQVQTMREQLDTARDQLTEARQTLDAMRGGRGMERLLSNTVRNYLPPSWDELEAVLEDRSSQYSALAAELAGLVRQNAVLSVDQLARLSTEDRQYIEAERRGAAMLQSTARRGLATSSERFSSLQQLIGAIGSASDQKAALDLQARIAAEQAMLINEQTKLAVLQDVARAEESARTQRVREQAIAGIGLYRELPPIGLR